MNWQLVRFYTGAMVFMAFMFISHMDDQMLELDSRIAEYDSLIMAMDTTAINTPEEKDLKK